MTPASEVRLPEILLATLPGSTAGQRVQVVLVQDSAAGSRIELQQQSFGEGVGWFTQGTVALEPEQIAELRGIIGTTGTQRGRELPAPYRQAPPPAKTGLRLCHADSA